MEWLIQRDSIIGGYVSIPTQYGSEKGDATHVRMSISEYNNLILVRDQAIAERDIAIKNAEKSKEESQKLLCAANEEYEKKCDILQRGSQIREARLQAEIEAQHSLNRNLKRIARERANKARKINKHDSGYIMQKLQSYYIKGHNGKNKLYRVLIQTPWSISLEEEDVDTLVKDSIVKKELVLTDAFEYIWDANDKDLMTVNDCEIPKILNRSYQANGRRGYWEVVFITNFEPKFMS